MEKKRVSPHWYCREKAKMAWRHRSRDEKTLIRVIGFLVFALICFIVAVTVMDLTFKAKIKKLEDELKTTTTSSSTTTDITDTTTDITDTTTAAPTTSSTDVHTTTWQPSTLDSSTSEGPPKVQPSVVEGLVEAFLERLSGRLTTKGFERVRLDKGVLKHTKARFILLADVQQEESNPMYNETHLIDSTLYKYGSPESKSSNESENTFENMNDTLTSMPFSYLTDDEELNDEYSGDSSTTEPSIDSINAEEDKQEGSGHGLEKFFSFGIF